MLRRMAVLVLIGILGMALANSAMAGEGLRLFPPYYQMGHRQYTKVADLVKEMRSKFVFGVIIDPKSASLAEKMTFVDGNGKKRTVAGWGAKVSLARGRDRYVVYLFRARGDFDAPWFHWANWLDQEDIAGGLTFLRVEAKERYFGDNWGYSARYVGRQGQLCLYRPKALLPQVVKVWDIDSPPPAVTPPWGAWDGGSHFVWPKQPVKARLADIKDLRPHQAVTLSTPQAVVKGNLVRISDWGGGVMHLALRLPVDKVRGLSVGSKVEMTIADLRASGVITHIIDDDVTNRTKVVSIKLRLE